MRYRHKYDTGQLFSSARPSPAIVKIRTAKARRGSGVHLQQPAFCQASQDKSRLQDVRTATGRRPSRQHCCQRCKHLPTTPPALSKSAFLDEFADLLASLGSGTGERLVICGDLNMPGSDAVNIDERLTSLLDIHGYQQHVTQSTRHDPRQLLLQRDNLLDLVITSTPLASPLVSDVEVFDIHGASDHDVVVTNLSVMRHKLPPTHYTYRDKEDRHRRFR